MSSQSFSELLRERFPDLSDAACSKMIHFRELVLNEGERQNLTRLTSPIDFLEGHVADAVELLKAGLLEYPAMDLGSGVGVPGIPCAIMSSGPWIIAESERRKAEFLEHARQVLGLSHVEVHVARGESVLRERRLASVVARAVGPVGRIYEWIRNCSTWNSLVLLKGPKWEQEWGEFIRSSRGKELKIDRVYSYTLGIENKKRIIVRLVRVPRGTITNP